MRLPERFAPAPYISGDIPDWHAGVLREIARQLGVGDDAYYPLIGAANKIEMFRRGASYAEAVAKEGGGDEVGAST